MPSKSMSHRALVCAALAKGESLVAPLVPSGDVTATLACLCGMGLIQTQGLEPLPGESGLYCCRLRGGLAPAPEGTRIAPCGESGSTLRFLMPLALDGHGPVRFEGSARLLERPLDPYRQLFAEQGRGQSGNHGIEWISQRGAITLQGQLHTGSFGLPGDVSSQFISGLLFALPRLPGDSVVCLTGPVESRGYIELTLSALAQAGVEGFWTDERTLRVPGGQTPRAGAFAVEGDWSHAAFYLVAGLVGGPLRLTGLHRESLQGDRAVVEILRGMGGKIAWEDGGCTAQPSTLRGGSIDASQVPDLVPALAVAACAAHGRTVIHGAARLRIKESDRLAALCAELSALGAKISEQADGLVIDGHGALPGGGVGSHNDHRIAMALAVAAALCEGPVELTGGESVAKSAPAFWEEYALLGGRSEEVLLS
jgi:3-phosphoshikimate 1-carboxyvinyltransferase